MSECEMLEHLARRWNVTLQSPWRSETEELLGWRVTLVPREGNWDDYPVFSGATAGEALVKAMKLS